MKPNSPGCKCCNPPLVCETRLGTNASGDSGGGNPVWLNPDNVLSVSAGDATVEVDAGQASEPLIVDTFGFSIPPTSTIVSVAAWIGRYSLWNPVLDLIRDEAVHFWQSGTEGATNYKETANEHLPFGPHQNDPFTDQSVVWWQFLGIGNWWVWPYEETVESWTPSDFDDGNGFRISLEVAGGSENAVARVSHIFAHVCYQ